MDILYTYGESVTQSMSWLRRWFINTDNINCNYQVFKIKLFQRVRANLKKYLNKFLVVFFISQTGYQLLLELSLDNETLKGEQESSWSWINSIKRILLCPNLNFLQKIWKAISKFELYKISKTCRFYRDSWLFQQIRLKLYELYFWMPIFSIIMNNPF